MIVHVYPEKDVEAHVTEAGGCWCEPRVVDEGMDGEGNPARVMVHQRILEKRGKDVWMRSWRSRWFDLGKAELMKKFLGWGL